MKTTKKTDAQEWLIIQNAKTHADIRALLRPWYSFRIHIKFKKALLNNSGQKQYASHFYGYEESWSYNQCMFGHTDAIVLNKAQGFERVIQMAEHQYKGKYLEATIYSRSVTPHGLFDIRHRIYDSKGKRVREIVDSESGEVILLQDPDISAEANRILHFSKISNYLVVHPGRELQEGDVPDILWSVAAVAKI